MFRKINAIVFFVALVFTMSAQASGSFDYDVFKTVTLPNFPNITVPVYKSSGTKGPSILLVHGNSASSRSYVRQVFSHFGRTHKLFLLDLPGNGNASKVDPSIPLPTQPNGLPLGFPQYQFGLIEAVATVANDPEVAAEIFVGWSLGGDVLLLAQGSGVLPAAKGIFIFGTAPAGANPPTLETPFQGPFVPGVAGLSILSSFGFSFQFDPTSPIGFNLNEQFVNPVPPYAPAPISDAANIGEAYIDAFFKESRRLSGRYPSFFTEDGFDRSDDRFRASVGVFAIGLLPPGPVPLPDELEVLENLSIPIAVVVGEQDAFINKQYLQDLKDGGVLPTLWRNEIIEINRAGHAAHYERPWRFNSLIRQFVRDVK